VWSYGDGLQIDRMSGATMGNLKFKFEFVRQDDGARSVGPSANDRRRIEVIDHDRGQKKAANRGGL
jgi:hypothetical protein